MDKRIKKIVALGLMFSFSLFSLAGCLWQKQTKPSVLVVAVNSLGFDKISCSSSENTSNENSYGDVGGKSGFKVFCNESIRFTHAYAPSVMALPSLASILTGHYPRYHKVRNNGANFIPEKIETIAETAVVKKYKTLFISGGVPVWSFSGINQGFEKFIDQIKISRHKLYRPAEEVFLSFKKFLKEIRSESFFSVLFLSDLQFPLIETKNNLEEVRPLHLQSQVDEIDEELYELINSLKKNGRWDSTNVILVGLNNSKPTTQDFLFNSSQLKGVSVFAKDTRVALFVKPARQKRDLGMRWKVDANISLVDIGKTIINIFESEGHRGSSGREDAISLNSIFSKKKNINLSRDRVILVESGWPLWKGYSNIRAGFRSGHWLIVNDERIKIFNSFIDNEESVWSSGDKSIESIDGYENILKRINNSGIKKWNGLNKSFLEKWTTIRNVYSDSTENGELEKHSLLLQFYKKYKWDEDALLWLLEESLRQNRFSSLQKIAESSFDGSWKYIAAKILENEEGGKQVLNGCMMFLKRSLGKEKVEKPNFESCNNNLLVNFLMWERQSKKSKERSKYRKVFFKSYISRHLRRIIYRENIKNNLFWNVREDFDKNLLMLDLVLSLPDFENERKSIARELKLNFL